MALPIWAVLLMSGAFLTFLFKAGATAGILGFLFAKPLVTIGALILFILLWKRR